MVLYFLAIVIFLGGMFTFMTAKKGKMILLGILMICVGFYTGVAATVFQYYYGGLI